MNTGSPTTTPPGASPSHSLGRKAAYGVGAVALVAIGALGTALVMRQPEPPPAETVATSPEALTSPAETPPTAPVDAPHEALPPKPAPKPKAAVHPAPAPAPARAEAPATEPAPRVAAATPAPAPVCTVCGVVESATPVEHKGEGTGLGAVTGGVVGGLLGHQVGGGTGRKIATVVGAVGGGLAGHEIEKRARSTTDYEVRVRMDDGTRRTLYSTQSWAVGERVEVDGNTLQPLGATPPAPPRTQSTSTNGY
jgi:outer membrane lipoprotein SlyB